MSKDPYHFALPPTWKQGKVANIQSGNFCQVLPYATSNFCMALWVQASGALCDAQPQALICLRLCAARRVDLVWRHMVQQMCSPPVMHDVW